MKIILYTSFILFLILQWGAKILPQIFGHSIVQWPVAVLLAIIIPIGFAKSLQQFYEKEKRNLKDLSIPISFIILFCLQLFLSISSFYLQNSLLISLNTNYNIAIKSLDILSSNAPPDSRKFSARLIYQEFGKEVPYKNEDGEYILFQPNEEDRKKFEVNSNTRKEQERLTDQLYDQSKAFAYLAIMQLACFMFIFPIVLILIEKFKPTKRSSGLAEARR